MNQSVVPVVNALRGRSPDSSNIPPKFWTPPNSMPAPNVFEPLKDCAAAKTWPGANLAPSPYEFEPGRVTVPLEKSAPMPYVSAEGKVLSAP